jgi:hypothetical protein
MLQVILYAGVILLLALVAASVYVINRRSHRPKDDVQPQNQDTEEMVETLQAFHRHGQMNTQQYETMESAVRTSDDDRAEDDHSAEAK